MQTYTVHTNGVPIRTFTDEKEAKEFLVAWTHDQAVQEMRLNLIDEVVAKSDLTAAKEVIKYIMEKK
jgi:hypothetical protein